MTRCLVCCEPLGPGEESCHPKCAQHLFGVRSTPRLAFWRIT